MPLTPDTGLLKLEDRRNLGELGACLGALGVPSFPAGESGLLGRALRVDRSEFDLYERKRVM